MTPEKLTAGFPRARVCLEVDSQKMGSHEAGEFNHLCAFGIYQGVGKLR